MIFTQSIRELGYPENWEPRGLITLELIREHPTPLREPLGYESLVAEALEKLLKKYGQHAKLVKTELTRTVRQISNSQGRQVLILTGDLYIEKPKDQQHDSHSKTASAP